MKMHKLFLLEIHYILIIIDIWFEKIFSLKIIYKLNIEENRFKTYYAWSVASYEWEIWVINLPLRYDVRDF